jgi:zinc transport system ATP-binding protein
MPVDVMTVEGLSYSYNAAEVLRDVSFRVTAGDYLGIVGPNGSGKSTLIKAVLGLVAPVQGAITLFGATPDRFRERQKVGYLPQRLKFFNPSFPATVEEIVRLGLLGGKRFPKRREPADDAAIEKTLGYMGITDIRRKLIGELSGGQQQRTLLARALVSDPQLLILDEPTTALDPETRGNFYKLLQHINQDHGTTIVLVTHDTWSIGRYASRFLYVDKRIVFDGTFDEFCQSGEMTAFFGENAQHVICHQH